MTTRIVALYARVSSTQQAAAGTIASQIAALRERIAADGLPLLPDYEFIDDGYSGATLLRPALERLRDAVAANQIDALYVHSPDRLARNYAYQVLLLDEFTRAGVPVVFLNRPLGESPEDDLLLQVQGMVAEYERAQALERSRRGKRHAAQAGAVSVLSGAPYGYRYQPKADRTDQAAYVVVPEEAAVVQQVFAWVGQERLSIGEVARRLTASATPTRQGKPGWDRSVIWAMLRNPAYKGQAAFGKTQATPRTRPLRTGRGRPAAPRHANNRADRTTSEWVYVAVPELVEPELWEAVQEQLAENRQRARTGQRGARYLLQGLVVCAQCGYAYYGKAISPSAAKHHERQYAYYRCIGTDAYRFGGERICHNKQVRTDYLDAAVWAQVQRVLEEPARVAAEYQARRQGPTTSAATEQARTASQVARLQQSVGRLVDGYMEGLLTKDEVEPRLARLRERLAQAEARQAEQAAAQQQATAEQEAVTALEAFAAQVRSGLTEADWTTQRDLIRALVKRVTIGEQEVEVVLRIGPGPPELTAQILQHCGRSNLPALGKYRVAWHRGRGVPVLSGTGTPRPETDWPAADPLCR
jgi:site-specific DNA recombinase